MARQAAGRRRSGPAEASEPARRQALYEQRLVRLCEELGSRPVGEKLDQIQKLRENYKLPCSDGWWAAQAEQLLVEAGVDPEGCTRQNVQAIRSGRNRNPNRLLLGALAVAVGVRPEVVGGLLVQGRGHERSGPSAGDADRRAAATRLTEVLSRYDAHLGHLDDVQEQMSVSGDPDTMIRLAGLLDKVLGEASDAHRSGGSTPARRGPRPVPAPPAQQTRTVATQDDLAPPWRAPGA